MTMVNPTSQALAQRQLHPGTRIQQQYANRIASLVPTHVNGEAWVRQLTGTLRDEKLSEAAMADFGSFIAAAERAAVLGLRPGTEEYYLIPRKIRGNLQVQGLVGYQGLVDLMYRSGAVSSVVVEVVRTLDRFDYSPGRMSKPLHDIDWDTTDRGDLRLVYAYAEMMGGGTSKVVVINRQKMYDEHRAKSEGYLIPIWVNKKKTGERINEHSPWVTNEESMWLKSAARQLAKWVPTSTEYIAQRAQAEHVAAQATAIASNLPAKLAAVPASGMPALPAAPPGVSPRTGEVTGDLLDDPAPSSTWFCEECQVDHDGLCPLEPAAEGQR